MKDRLYIDGHLVDIQDTGINLDYKSNLLTDITKITSNNSYTIKAPKTVGNLRIIQGFILPSTAGEYPYIAHSGVVERDGVQIITGATVYLLSVGEEIEFCLVWGIGSQFENIKDKKLTEMPIVEGDTAVWDQLNPDDYLKINYGIDFPPATAARYMPHITAYDLLMRISKANGIDIIINDSSIVNNLQTLGIPLLSRNDCSITSEKNKLSLYAYEKSDGGFIPDLFDSSFDFLFNASENKTNIYGSWTYDPDNGGIVGYHPNYAQTMTIKGTITANCSRIDQSGRALLIMYRHDPTTGENDEVTRVEGTFDGSSLSFPVDGMEIDFSDGYSQAATLRFMIATQSNVIVNSFSCLIEVSCLFDAIIPSMDYYVVPNLPDMKQIDFIKGICQMFNYYAFQEETDIVIMSFNTLISNKSKAVDWSGKIIGEPEMEFTVDGINRTNNVRYKEDDSVKGNYDSYFTVNNQALDPEDDFITLPFAACDTRSGVALIPIYSYDNEGNVEIEDKATPRIVRIKRVAGEQIGSFEELTWSNLLKSYYGQYISTVGKAKVITCNMLLNCVDLKTMDMSIPVYISELGSFFGIVEVKTKDNDLCEVSLIKI